MLGAPRNLAKETSMAGESRKAVYAAIVGNTIVAIIKFIAAFFTGSSAMISEGIHSLVDAGNGGLLYIGMRRAQRPADDEHPFGHGKELYFWSFVVAISIFGIGGGMSIYEGILHILHPAPLEDPTLAYVVLAIAAVIEGGTFWVALREFRRDKGSLSTLDAVRTGKDPSLFTVLFEDTAAVLGLLVAFLGVFLGHLLRNPYIDGAASVVIGLILTTVALWLARESKGLLLGESADPALIAGAREILSGEPGVLAAGRALTMHLGPHDVLLNIEAAFDPALTAEDVHLAIDRVEERIRSDYPDVKHIYIEAESLTGPEAHHSPEQ
jgi:cation diffusion facilitator family transporter